VKIVKFDWNIFAVIKRVITVTKKGKMNICDLDLKSRPKTI
jgi:hypothetical protein